MACEHGNRPPCDLKHSKPKMDNTKRLWGSVIKYLDPVTMTSSTTNYKSINKAKLELK